MKIAIIGCGGRIANVIQTMHQLDPSITVNAILDPDPAAKDKLIEAVRQSVSLVDSIEALLATKPDALAIGTRCHLHAALAMAVATSGLPLFLEKPVATTLEQATALQRAYAGRENLVVVSFPLRLTPLAEQVKRIISSPEFGRVEHLAAINYVPYGDTYFKDWYRDAAITQGLFLQKATHDLDYLMDLAGSPITEVSAMSTHGRVYRDAASSDQSEPAHYLPSIGTPDSGMNEDSSSVLFRFADGRHGVYTQQFFTRGKAAFRGATLGSLKGTLRFDWYQGSIEHWHHDRPFSHRAVLDSTVSHWGGDLALARAFIACVRDQAPSPTPLSAGLRSAYACIAAKASAECGRFMTVTQVDDVL